MGSMRTQEKFLKAESLPVKDLYEISECNISQMMQCQNSELMTTISIKLLNNNYVEY